MRASSTGTRFAARAIALADCTPIFAAAEFSGGPILLVNDALAAGGVERQVINTLRGLERRGHTANLLCLSLHQSPELDFFLPKLANFSGFVRNAVPGGLALAMLRSITSRANCDRMHAAIAWLPADVQIDVLRFAAEFARLKPSVVHAWQDTTNIAAAYGAWLVGVPRILVSCRNLAPTNFGYFRSCMPYCYREIAACSRIVMINNSAVGARDYASWLGLPADRFVILRNGIDTRALIRPAPDKTAALRSQLGIPAAARIVGSMFRYDAEKRPLLWIEVAAQLDKLCPGCHFVVFGDGPLKSLARDAARRYGLAGRVHLQGSTENPELALSLFDVVLLTSRFEGTPNVVLEATVLGIPVVAADAGGLRETVVENTTGRVVAGAAPAELATAVMEVLDDPSWAARAKAVGPALIEQRFGIGRMLDEVSALYRD